MELTVAKSIRNEYLKLLSEEESFHGVVKNLISKKESEPIYDYEYLNHEEPPDYKKEQRELLEVNLDINIVNQSLVEIKDRIDELISEIDYQINAVNEAVKNETERITDINMLCGNSSEYNMVIPISNEQFTADSKDYVPLKDDVISCNLYEKKEVGYIISNISGNGYQGNRYVYNDGLFEFDEDDKSSIEYIYDESDVTGYEYSRLVTTNKNEVIDSLINYDDKEVKCTVTLNAEQNASSAYIKTENSDLVIESIETSDDGILFVKNISKPIKISETDEIYNDFEYIYGSNIICFKPSKYIRITFSSSNNTNDKIAIDDNGTANVKFDTKRKKIKINNIKLYSNTYSSVSVVTDNIVSSGSVDKVGLFLNEYIPDHFSSVIDYVTYFLIINGVEYEVVPINSNKNGIKIIKFSEDDLIQGYSQKINETIKSVAIKIILNTNENKESPLISNVKLCLGKDTGSIYV